MRKPILLSYHFSNAFPSSARETGKPLFLRTSGIQGSLRVINARPDDIDAIKIVLGGSQLSVVTQHLPQKPLAPPVHHTLFKSLIQLVDAQDASYGRSPVASANNARVFTFNFQLVGDQVMDMLPASMSVVASGSEARVRYELQAFVMDDGKIKASICQEICLYDSPTSIPPPVCADAFPGVYVLSVEKLLKAKRARWRGHKMVITVAEPPPVLITNQRQQGLAGFPVRFQLFPDSKPPSHIEVTARWQLCASTFISASEMGWVPTKSQSLATPNMTHLSATSDMSKTKLSISNWAPLATKEEYKPTTECVKEMVLWLGLFERSYPAPTFFTPHLARQYSVALELELSGSGIRRKRFAFQVPLQIMYRLVGGSNRNSGIDQLGHVPIYVA